MVISFPESACDIRGTNVICRKEDLSQVRFQLAAIFLKIEQSLPHLTANKYQVYQIFTGYCPEENCRLKFTTTTKKLVINEFPDRIYVLKLDERPAQLLKQSLVARVYEQELFVIQKLPKQRQELVIADEKYVINPLRHDVETLHFNDKEQLHMDLGFLEKARSSLVLHMLSALNLTHANYKNALHYLNEERDYIEDSIQIYKYTPKTTGRPLKLSRDNSFVCLAFEIHIFSTRLLLRQRSSVR